MNKYSKAIAAVIASIVGIVVAFDVVSPALADVLTPTTIEVVSGLIVTALVAFGVFVAPANAES